MSNEQPDACQGTILVVDDMPENLRLLANILAEQGYIVQPVRNGPMALSVAQSALPDLILLDIMMPEMNGYEVCEQLKADDRTRDIPVIFITALHDIFDKVKAFSIGGVDYITKPFQVEEVLARIATHLTLRRTQQRLQEQVAELDAFARTVAHDLKNPLGIVIGYADLLAESAATISRDELAEHLLVIRQTGRKAFNIIDELLLLTGVHKAKVNMTALEMTSIVDQAQQRLQLMIKEYQGEITLPKTWPIAWGYAPWIEEVWVNYLSNGLKYGGQPPRLELGATSQKDGMIRFWIRDNGSGLTSDEQAILFTEFTRLSEVRAEGYGLGLSIVRRIVDKLGGEVGVESEVGQGSIFYFTLPSMEEDRQDEVNVSSAVLKRRRGR